MIKWITSTNTTYPLDYFRQNPCKWLEWIGFDTYWDKQREVIESVRDNVRTACRSGHTVGKTRIAAASCLWFLFNFFPSVVITTATTGRQVTFLLWGEIRQLYRELRLKVKQEYGMDTGARLFETDYLGVLKGLWYALGFSTDQPEAVTGFHEKNILIIIDEGSGVKECVFEGAETSLNSPNSRILTIGNPTDPISYFGKIFLTKEGSDWNKIHIDCEESPNVIAGRNVIPGLCNYDWPSLMARKWGRNDPRFLVRVKGEFPEAVGNSLVSYNKAYSAYVKDLELYYDMDWILAMDVAREGDDSTVILLREKSIRDDKVWIDEGNGEGKKDEWGDIRDNGNSDNGNSDMCFDKGSERTEKIPVKTDQVEIGAKIVKKIPKHRTMDAVAEIVKLIKENSNITDICIDVVGVGSGVVDRLEEMKESGEVNELKNVNIWAVNVGEGALDKKGYLNLRAELAEEVRKEIENETILYNDEDIIDQVSQIVYKPHSRGVMMLEPKEVFKGRYKRSPDELDSLCISFAPRILKLKRAEPRIRIV